jgi:hypothetical protein
MHQNRLKKRSLLKLAITLALGFYGQRGFAQESKPASDYLADLAALARDYKIEVISTDCKFPVQMTTGEIGGAIAEQAAVEAYAPLFLSEFHLYPPSLIEKVGLKKIVLCTDVAFAGQRRNAIPDFEHDVLYLDVLRGGYSKTYLRKVIHHEFFHMIDIRDDGKLYRDERWAALNGKDFQYGDGGRNAQSRSSTSHFTDAFPGFLNHYSTTGVEEDKAEIFANLIVDTAHVAKCAESDSVLKSKIAQLRALLLGFCPDMNDAFWQRAKEVKRPVEKPRRTQKP